MAFSYHGASLGGVAITNAECVKKTFPDYWKLFGSIGGVFETYGVTVWVNSLPLPSFGESHGPGVVSL